MLKLNPRNTVGQFIRLARERCGLTQAELARRFGYSTAQFVSNWERGVSLPPVKHLRQLATILNVRAWDLARVFNQHEREMASVRGRQLAKTLRVRA